MNTFKKQPILLILAALTCGPVVMQAGNKVPPPPAQTRSVFIIPTNPKEGRDPFFPESTRVFDQMATASRTNQAVVLPPLTVLGISGTPGNLLAIINNHTFAAGDEGDVLTAAGNKVHIRCVAVGENHVNVLVNGQNIRLNMGE